MKEFIATRSGVPFVRGKTPRQAAKAFFERYPTKRKCTIGEGTFDGPVFQSVLCKDRVWLDVTRNLIPELPDHG